MRVKAEWREKERGRCFTIPTPLCLVAAHLKFSWTALQLKLKLSSIEIKSVASSFCVDSTLYTRQMLYNYYFLMYDVLKLNIAINQHKNLWKYAAATVVLDQLCSSFCAHTNYWLRVPAHSQFLEQNTRARASGHLDWVYQQQFAVKMFQKEKLSPFATYTHSSECVINFFFVKVHTRRQLHAFFEKLHDDRWASLLGLDFFSEIHKYILKS